MFCRYEILENIASGQLCLLLKLKNRFGNVTRFTCFQNLLSGTVLSISVTEKSRRVIELRPACVDFITVEVEGEILNRQ